MKTVMISHPDHPSDFYAPIYVPLEWQRQGLTKTTSGYGTKIPTTYMLDYQGKRRRIYVDQYSNAGHTYIMIGGKKITVC